MNTYSLVRNPAGDKPPTAPVPIPALAVLLAILLVGLWAAPVRAQLPAAGTPSGNGVQPVVVTGNPDCADLGYGFGFKVDGSPEGTFPLTSAAGELTGGAPPDPSNSVTIANSDGQYFDWTATLGIDVVIVKAGPNANSFTYLPESGGDTALHGPINPSNGEPFGVSHIEFCYDYEVDVAKDATTTFTRTWHWSIDKAVAPATWDLFTGDAGTSKYAVSVERTGFTDSDWAVAGTITVTNATPFDALLTGVTDAVSGGIAAAVDCGVSLPYLLGSGETLECTYSTPLPDGSQRLNTATASTDGAGPVGGGEATADVVFGAPTTEVNATVSVTDSNGLAWGPVSDDATWMYEVAFACDGDAGSHANVATIVETGQSDDATVSVTCHGLEVTKNAATSYRRTWEWSLDKSADESALTLAPGQTFQVTYEVDLAATAVDDRHAVSGEVWVSNPHPSASANLVSVSDLVSPAVAATVDCPALVIPAGGSLHCTYSADLPDGAPRTNTATATLQNVSIAADGTVAPAGTTAFDSAPVPVLFGDPTTEVDACVDVDDSLAGPLGTLCAADAPGGFTYTRLIGPYAEPDDCGENRVVNTASFTTSDTGTTGEDGWTVTVEVACGAGCTLTPGYWKTHSELGPAPYDDTWADLGGAGTPFFLSGQSYHQVLWTPPQGGNAYYILAHAYIAAELNVLNGASAPPEVLDAFDEATLLFGTYTPDEIGALKGNRPPRPRLLELAGLLDMYNNGLIGPGHCSEDDTSAP